MEEPEIDCVTGRTSLSRCRFQMMSFERLSGNVKEICTGRGSVIPAQDLRVAIQGYLRIVFRYLEIHCKPKDASPPYDEIHNHLLPA